MADKDDQALLDDLDREAKDFDKVSSASAQDNQVLYRPAEILTAYFSGCRD